MRIVFFQIVIFQSNKFIRQLALAGINILVTACLLAGCASPAPITGIEETAALATPSTSLPSPTPLPTRPAYEPGTLVDYIAQDGDTLPALAAHFNTTIQEIRDANPVIPADATTMPVGFPMRIPIYYKPLWGIPYQIIPNSLFVNGPAQVGFDVVQFVDSQPGWFKAVSEYTGDATRRGGEIIEQVAVNYSVSPRVLLALLEYQTGALSQPQKPDGLGSYPLGYEEQFHKGFYMQLIWAANTLNNGYYGWVTGALEEFVLLDDRIERPDPWQNAATVALQYYFSQILPADEYQQAIYSDGFGRVYERLFGAPWGDVPPIFPGSLTQPDLQLPFVAGKQWAFTGGPHTGWGEGAPWAALDFAPPDSVGGCNPTKEYAVAMADGVITRTGEALAVLDLDGDGDERTGWAILYLHLSENEKIKTGAQVKTGDPLGHPSCEGGLATGTHVHIARKYNGQWVPAEGPLAFNLNGWIAYNGRQPYLGRLMRNQKAVIASVVSNAASLILNDSR